MESSLETGSIKEAIIFIGIPASGKSSFYREHFQGYTHINLDRLHTRNKERLALEVCIRDQLSFVVDNTNPTVEDRAKYIKLAKENGYRIVGYYFQSSISECLSRNSMREGKARVPDIAVKSVHSKMELPKYSEGFDKLCYVHMEANGFAVEDWKEE